MNKLYCNKCGSSNVQLEAWVNPNTNEIIDASLSAQEWCDDCEEETTLLTRGKLFENFSNLLFDSNNKSEEKFLKFDIGTDKQEIYNFFFEIIMNLVEILKDCPKGTKLYTPIWGEVTFIEVEDKDYVYPICIYTNTCTKVQLTKNGCFISSTDSECILFPSKEQRDWSKFAAPWYKKETGTIDNIEKQCEQTTSQTNERAWLYLISDVLTWKDGIGQYLDDPRVQELVKKLCSKYSQKFGVGDWITSNLSISSNLLCIIGVDKTNYEVITPQGSTGVPSIRYIDEHYHLWTIQDAKDGDVIRLGTVTAIFKKYIGQEKCICYCSFCKDGGFEIPIENGEDNVYGCYNATPATKEQRDFLFQKMKEADYEWDTDKKELKKLVKPKFKVGDKIRHKITNKDDVYEISKVYDDSYGIAGFNWMIYIKYQDQYELVPDKFDPKTLQPFDKILVKRYDNIWVATLLSHSETHTYGLGISYLEFTTINNGIYKSCIPYNEDTKHLVGTTNEAPEYYRYWED